MSTVTPRLGLTLPATTEAYDIAVANGNMTLLDAAPANAVICTSSTHPSASATGDLIFESDTQNFLIRHSATWKGFNARAYLCTSGARPTSAQSLGGLIIFETDTGRFLVRNSANSAWLFPTIAFVAALSDITSPLNNQIAFEGATRSWSLYDSSAPMWAPISVSGQVRSIYPSQTTPLTAAVSAETDVPKLAFTTVSLLSGHRYEFEYKLNLGTSAAADAFDLNLRKGAAVTGTLVQTCRHIAVATGNFSPTVIVRFYYTAAITEVGTANFRLSVARSAGGGTIQVYQDATMVNFATMRDMGIPGAGIVTTVA